MGKRSGSGFGPAPNIFTGKSGDGNRFHKDPRGPDPYLPPIVRDIPVPAPIVSVILPNPRVLIATSKTAPNQFPLAVAKPGDPEPYIFGRCIADPVILTVDDSTDNLYVDMLWSVGECDYIEYLIVDNTNEGRGDALGHIEHFEGAIGQATSPNMIAIKGDYDELDGKCHSVLRIRPNRDTLNVRAMIRGLKLYDPRNSPATTAFSKNPALMLARILTDCGYTMDWSSVGDVADYCDDILGGSPQQKRWEVGLQIKDRQDLRNWVQTFAVYAQCFVELQGSNAYLIADKPRSPNHTVTASDMLAGSVSVSRTGGRNVPERVVVSYTKITETGNPFNNNPSIPGVDWVSLNETRSAETATSADSGTTSNLPLPGIQSYSRARRMADQIYARSRNDMTLEFVGFDDGIKRTIGDVGTITNSQFGLSAAEMALIENRPVDRGRWLRKYLTYSDDNYLDTLPSEPAQNDVYLLNANQPPTGPTPTLSLETYTDAYDETQNRIRVEWDGAEWSYMRDYHVVVTGDDEGETVLLDTFVEHDGAGEEHVVYTGPVAPGVTYEASIKNQSVTFMFGSAATATIDSDGGYVVAAKHYGNGLDNYYRIGSAAAASPKIWVGGLLPSTGSGDTWQYMTLVFCVCPVVHDDEKIFIFGSRQSAISIASNDSDGGLWLDIRDPSSGLHHNVTITDVLPVDVWSSVMIAAYPTASPQKMSVVVWVGEVGGAPGAEVYNGDWNADFNQVSPMDWSGPVYAGAGDFGSGTAPGADPDLWEGLNCYVSYVWAAEQYFDPATYWSNFFDGANRPKNIGEDGNDGELITSGDLDAFLPATFAVDGNMSTHLGFVDYWDEVGTVPDAPSSPSD